MKQHAKNFRLNVASCCEAESISAIAQRAEVSRVYLSRILNGHATPSVDVASAIAKAVRVPLSDLLETAPSRFRAPQPSA